MVQKTIKALYKQPVNYKLIKDGYKTVNGVIQAEDGMPKVVDLPVPSELYTTDLQYNVNTEVNGAPIVTTEQFILPDDETCEAKQYCYAPKGMSYTYRKKQNVKYYDNFTVVESPTISNGIISNFSSSNYIQLTNTFPSFTTCELVFKALRTSNSQFGALISKDDSSVGAAGVDNSSGAFGKNNGSTWTSGITVIELNKYYWYKIIGSGDTFTGYLLEDNNYTKDTLPSIENWSLEWTNTGNTFTGERCVIGNSLVNSTEYWVGSIDLNQTYIKINDEIWWVPYTYHEEEITTQIPGILDSSVTIDNWQQNQEYKLYQLKNQNNTDSLQLTENSITNNNQRYNQYINQITIPAREYKWYYHGIPQGYYEEFYYNGDVSIDNKIASFMNGMVEFHIYPHYYYSPFTTVMQFKTGNDVSNQSLMKIVNWHYDSSVSEYEEKCIYFSCIHNGKFSITNDENLENFNDGSTLLPNTKYWLAIYLYQNGVDTYLLTDDEYSKYSLPPLSSWNKQISLAFSYMIDIVDNEWIFGQYMDTNQVSVSYPPFVGKLYLENCIAFNELSTSYDQLTWEAYHYYNYEYKWMANKSLYKNIENTDAANVLDFSDSYINVSQYNYNQYKNPKVCLMPIDGGETDSHLYTIEDIDLHGCLYNYDDDGSEHSFDVYYDSNYTQPILVNSGETYLSGTKVDTITIPQHNVWTYQAGGTWTKIIP